MNCWHPAADEWFGQRAGVADTRVPSAENEHVPRLTVYTGRCEGECCAPGRVEPRAAQGFSRLAAFQQTCDPGRRPVCPVCGPFRDGSAHIAERRSDPNAATQHATQLQSAAVGTVALTACPLRTGRAGRQPARSSAPAPRVDPARIEMPWWQHSRQTTGARQRHPLSHFVGFPAGRGALLSAAHPCELMRRCVWLLLVAWRGVAPPSRADTTAADR